MKTLLLTFAAAAMMLASCETLSTYEEHRPENGTTENPQGQTVKEFTFHVKGAFNTRYDEMTRAAVRLEADNTAGLTDLWVLDYAEDGTLLQTVHQTTTQEGITFGSVPMSLTYGHHDIKFVASRGTEAELTATALTWGRVKDTFVLDYPVDVVASSNGNRAPELKRNVSGLALQMTDAVPANAREIQITARRSLSLSLPTLTAGALAENTVTMSFPESWRGTRNNTASTYTLCPTDEFTTDVSVRVIATDGSVMSEFSVPSVQLKKNSVTTLTGEVFNRTSGFQVMFDDSWGDAIEVNF